MPDPLSEIQSRVERARSQPKEWAFSFDDVSYLLSLVGEMREALKAACPEDGIDRESNVGGFYCVWCNGEGKHYDGCGWAMARAALAKAGTK